MVLPPALARWVRASTQLRPAVLSFGLPRAARRFQHTAAASSSGSVPDTVLQHAKELLRPCTNVLAITGAGISTDSGIPDYRSPGRPPHRPTSHQQFMASHLTRQRYWARSLGGFVALASAKPNAGHRALAHASSPRASSPRVPHIITQNVDLMHEAAGSDSVLHLHGTIENVRCMSCDHVGDRGEYQRLLTRLNPSFAQAHGQAPRSDVQTPEAASSQPVARSGSAPQEQHAHMISLTLGANPVSLVSPSPASSSSLRPDADTELPQGMDFSQFVLPSCPNCTDGQGNFLHSHTHLEAKAREREQLARNSVLGGVSSSLAPLSPMQHGVLKPDLVFFGANVPKGVHARADELLAAADGLLVVGTSLTVWSAFRLLRHTLDRVHPEHEISVMQLADSMQKAAQEQLGGRGGNTISDGAATLAPVTPFTLPLHSSSSSSRRVSSVLPIVILNQGPTRADPLIAHASNIVKVEHVRAAQALNYILGVPESES